MQLTCQACKGTGVLNNGQSITLNIAGPINIGGNGSTGGATVQNVTITCTACAGTGRMPIPEPFTLVELRAYWTQLVQEAVAAAQNPYNWSTSTAYYLWPASEPHNLQRLMLTMLVLLDMDVEKYDEKRRAWLVAQQLNPTK